MDELPEFNRGALEVLRQPLEEGLVHIRRAFTCNAHIDSAATRKHCVLEDGPDKLLQTAIDQLGFNARAYDKVLSVARTLADLDEADTITEPHVAEAIQYRSLDRQLF